MHDLVCPRDHLPLVRSDTALTCTAGHCYPVHGGIPVFILDDVDQTHGEASRALRLKEIEYELTRDDGATPPRDQVDPLVREILGGTCGNMYKAVRNEIDHYPIPELRLPAGAGARFLDIGCNWGRWSVAAAQKGYAVTGVDPSFGALVVARRIFRQFGLEGRFICADARHLPFKDDSFDVVFSYSVLQHFSKDDVRATLRQIARIMTGHSHIQMANKFGVGSAYHRLRRLFSQLGVFHVRYWSPRELLAAFDADIGRSQLEVDGFFGLGMQASDLASFRPHHRLILRLSERLRRFNGLTPLADSLYVNSQSSKPGLAASNADVLARQR